MFFTGVNVDFSRIRLSVVNATVQFQERNMSILTSLFGSRNSRLLKQYGKTVAKINSLEPALEKLSDAELQAKTPEFKERLAKGESLDSILPEAFAVCREASKRVLKMRPFDVQLIGGMALACRKNCRNGNW